MTGVSDIPDLPERPVDGHKGTFGRVLVIAGSRGMSGAACLAATAALRGGAGLVFVAVPDGIQSIVAGFEPSYLTVPLPEDDAGRIDLAALKTLRERAEGMDAVAIGPGLGQSAGLRALTVELYRELPVPLVVDADALNLLARSSGSVSNHRGVRVITPHVGEFARLTGRTTEAIVADREPLATEFAAAHDLTLALKGPGTVVTDGQRTAVNDTGNSGLATGGTGDVLTGVVASLLGQGMDAFAAVRLAVHLHGLAGDHAAAVLGERAMIASDVLDALAAAWQRLEQNSQE